MSNLLEIKNKSLRVIAFDELRGFMIVNVILYHLFYDLTYIFDVTILWFESPLAYFWQKIISCSLIFISGACSYYSRNNIRRGIGILFYALLLTLTTYILMPKMIVIFGILHCLGMSIILFAFIKPILYKVPIPIGMLVSFALFIITYKLSDGYIGIDSWNIILPNEMYMTPYLFMFGFPSNTFFSSDYFPMLPYFFMFICGSYMGILAKNNCLPEYMYNVHFKIFTYIGKNSIWIYLLHQPIIYFLLWFYFKYLKSLIRLLYIFL